MTAMTAMTAGYHGAIPSGPHLDLAVFQDTTQRNLGIGQGHIGTGATLAGLRNLQKFQKKT